MTSSSHRFGRFELRTAQRRLLVDGHPVTLGARAFDVLAQLIERRDRVVGSAELFALVWPGLVVEDNNLRQQVAALRKLLGAEAIVTVPGRGYRFALALEGDDAVVGDEAVKRSERATLLNRNLPLNLPILIGREDELAAVTELLAHTHLLTLVGAGGVGKTSLALAAAHARQHAQRDGAAWVDLSSISEPTLVCTVVARALKLPEASAEHQLSALLAGLKSLEVL